MSPAGVLGVFAAGVAVGLVVHSVREQARARDAAAAVAAAEAVTIEAAPAGPAVTLHRAPEPERFAWAPIRSTVRLSGAVLAAVLWLALATLRAVAGAVRVEPREIRPALMPVLVTMPPSARAPRVDLWSRCCRAARPVRGPDRAEFFTLDTRSFPGVSSLI